MGPLLQLVLQRALLVLKSIDFHRLPDLMLRWAPLLQLVLQKVLLVLKSIDHAKVAKDGGLLANPGRDTVRPVFRCANLAPESP